MRKVPRESRKTIRDAQIAPESEKRTGTPKTRLAIHVTSTSGQRLRVLRVFSRSAVSARKRWQQGDHIARWTAAGLHEAERNFRRVKAYRELVELAKTLNPGLPPYREPPLSLNLGHALSITAIPLPPHKALPPGLLTVITVLTLRARPPFCGEEGHRTSRLCLVFARHSGPRTHRIDALLRDVQH